MLCAKFFLRLLVAHASDVLHEHIEHVFGKKSYTAAKTDKVLSVTQVLEMLSIFVLNQNKLFFFPLHGTMYLNNLTLTQLGNKMFSELF